MFLLIEVPSEIRSAVIEGDIDAALKRTHAFYPQVLKDRSHVYFRLRCQKFKEMIREAAELLPVAPSKSAKASNGHAPPTTIDDHEEMEVDEQKHEGEDWDKMETEEADNTIRYREMLGEALHYAQAVKQEFQDDPSTDSTLKDIFAFFLYEDPRTSPQAYLLDRAGRTPVAEELNSAILGILPPHTYQSRTG